MHWRVRYFHVDTRHSFLGTRAEGRSVDAALHGGGSAGTPDKSASGWAPRPTAAPTLPAPPRA